MLRKPKKPGSRAGLEWTAAQQRAFTVFNLRGLWGLVGRLSEPRRSQVRAIIDDEIRDHGGESESMRMARRRAEFEELPF